MNLGKLIEGKEFDDDAEDSDLVVSEAMQEEFVGSPSPLPLPLLPLIVCLLTSPPHLLTEWDWLDEELNDMLETAVRSFSLSLAPSQCEFSLPECIRSQRRN